MNKKKAKGAKMADRKRFKKKGSLLVHSRQTKEAMNFLKNQIVISGYEGWKNE